MLIVREQLECSLRNFIKKSDGIIIGPPGIGKTYLLKKITFRFTEQNIPCLYLPIDKIDVENDDELANALHFKGDFINGLSNHPEVQKEKGFLIFDSFDSAKSEKSKKFYLNLIERAKSQLCGKWRVIVSVRTFDAKKSQKLIELFPRSSSENISDYHSNEILCRHFLIPELTDDELQATLDGILNHQNASVISNSDIWNLLKIPFNLWLFEQLIYANSSINELKSISSQVELLNVFWKTRVHYTNLWQEKEKILRLATSRMVKSRSLLVHIDDICQSDLKEPFHSLLSDQILVETSRNGQYYAFSHNILFDYAVSVLLLDETVNTFLSFISEDASRQLFLRPSLDFYFTDLWKRNPENFWMIFWNILELEGPKLKILVRLTQTNVISNEAENVGRLQPIINELDNGNPLGLRAVLYLLQALDSSNIENEKLWIDFLDNIGNYLNKEFIWNFSWVLSKIVDKSEENGDEDLFFKCGNVGRRLLSWVLGERQREKNDYIDGVGANWVVPIVAKTYRTCPNDSGELLRTVLSIRNEPDFPIMYIYRLIKELEHIWPVNTEFVELVYTTVFSSSETSDGITPFGTPVLPLTSTRRQDYEMCCWLLAKNYSLLLGNNPLAAIKLAINSLNEYIISEHIVPYINHGFRLSDIREKIFLNRKEMIFYPDGCHIWDTSGHTDVSIKIGNECFEYLSDIAENDNEYYIDNFLKIFFENVSVAFFWRRLLGIASKYPEIFAHKLFDLCVAEKILSGGETIKEIGDFIEKSSKFYSNDEMLEIELSLINLPKKTDLDIEGIERLERIRDRLLARIPKGRLQTRDGQAIRDSMEKIGKIPANEPLIKWERGFRESTDEDFLEMSGVDPFKESNKVLLKLCDPLRTFSEDWANNTPDQDSIAQILPLLKNVFHEIDSKNLAAVEVNNLAWTYLASCTSIICAAIIQDDKETIEFCREVLLKSAIHSEPKYDPEYHSKFDYPSWSPAPRNEAAIALPRLAQVQSDGEILKNIKKLAIDDKVPSVRYLVISRLLFLWESSAEFVWDVLEIVVNLEKNQVILNAACTDVSKLWWKDAKRAELLLNQLFEKTLCNGETDRSNPLPSVIIGLAIFQNNEWAIKKFETIVNESDKYSKYYGYFVFELSQCINPKCPEYPLDINNRSKAIRMLDNIYDSTSSNIIKSISNQDNLMQENIQNNINELYMVIHDIVIRFYFAIEKEKSKEDSASSLKLNMDRKDLYFAFKPLLTKIIDFSGSDGFLKYNAQTLHYLIEIFNEVIDFDPKYSVQTVARLILNCDDTNYVLDPMATDEMLKFAEKIICDYKDLLQDDATLNDFMTIIDSFVKNGNKEMMKFVWRLDEIYR